MIRKYLLKLLVVFILCFTISYNLYQFAWNNQFEDIQTSLDDEINTLRSLNLTEEQNASLNRLETKIKFQNNICFKNG